MPGGLLQLTLQGASDVYLTGNPQITFFKVVYKRYSSFAIEQKNLTIYGPPKFGSKTTYCRIRDSGADLLNKVYLNMTVTGTSDKNYKWAYVKNLGHTILKEYKISIGNVEIDKQYGEWLDIWLEMNLNNKISNTYDKLIGNLPEAINLSTDNKTVELFIPLQFWFCSDCGLSLPLASIYDSDIEFKFKFKKASECVIKESGISNLQLNMSNVSLLVNYILLDIDERNTFINNKQEYLIQQIQYNGYKLIDPRKSTIKLNYNNPCKTLYWILKRSRFAKGDVFLSTNSEDATKRVVLGYCKKNNTHFLDGSGTELNVGESLVPLALVGDEISDIITNSTVKKQFTPGTFGSINDVNISDDYVLTSKQISIPISEFIKNYELSAITRNKTGDGSINKDIVLYQWNNYNLHVDYTDSIINKCDLIVNGKHVYNTDTSDYQYLNIAQGYQYYDNVPSNNLYLYTFSLDPNNFEPLGALNFSQINKASLKISFNDQFTEDFYSNEKFYSLLSVFMESYNVLKIVNGQAELLYSLTSEK
jgi:hypothetical protein